MMKRRFALFFIVITVSAGCTTLPTQQCKSLRETAPVILTIEDMDGSYHRTAYDTEVVQNPDSRVGLTEVSNVLGAYKYRLVPVEACGDGLRVRYEDSSKQSEAFVPWNRETVIEGSRESGHFVAITARQK